MYKKVFDNYFGIFFHVFWGPAGKPVMSSQHVAFGKAWMNYVITLSLS